MAIRNPIELVWATLKGATLGFGTEGRTIHRRLSRAGETPNVRKITADDLRDALRLGMADFGACRTDVLFLCLIYPVIGLVLARLAVTTDMLPLLFPLASGFALMGPFLAIGLYEMSRERETRPAVTWGDAFGLFDAPRFRSILGLGLILTAFFLVWMLTALAICWATIGLEPPESLAAFAQKVLLTEAGWALIVIGVGVGFCFAVIAMAMTVASFPLLLDRDIDLWTAVRLSVRAVRANPAPMAAWGLIVVAGLVIGSLPLFVGLIVVMPVLGHSTWHLYRRLIEA